MRKVKNYILAAMGIIIFSAGLYFINTVESPQTFMVALPYVCIGVGSGIWGYGMSNIITNQILQKKTDMQRQMEIANKDERNIIIANRAKAKAYDFMIFIFAALMIAFSLMGVGVMPVLLFVFTYLLVQGYAVYYRFKYEKEM